MKSVRPSLLRQEVAIARAIRAQLAVIMLILTLRLLAHVGLTPSAGELALFLAKLISQRGLPIVVPVLTARPVCWDGGWYSFAKSF